MADSRFLRKPIPAEYLADDVQKGLLFCLLRVMFDVKDDGDEERLAEAGIAYAGETYAAKELAADLGISQFSVYPMLGEGRTLSLERGLCILSFVHFKNPNDLRLIDFIAARAGCTAMPNRRDVDHKAARRLIMEAYEVIGAVKVSEYNEE